MKVFEMKRFLKACEIYLYSNPQQFLLPTLVSTGIAALFATAGLLLGFPVKLNIYMLVGAGLFAAAIGAHKAHGMEQDAASQAFHMLLPLSQMERFLARIFLTLLLPFVGQIMLLFPVSYLFYFVSKALHPETLSPLWPSGHEILTFVPAFFAWHASMFVGGAYFKSSGILKTLFSIFAVGVLVVGACAAAGLAQILLKYSGNLSELLTSLSASGVKGSDLPMDSWPASWMTSTQILEVAVFGVQPLLLYLVAYFKASEFEARA